jgi:hypothetical protein
MKSIDPHCQHLALPDSESRLRHPNAFPLNTALGAPGLKEMAPCFVPGIILGTAASASQKLGASWMG